MDDPLESELLSAYLDGELTASERVEVERLLAVNPAARQLLDELRALRAALQALPPRKLGEDLSRQVSLDAERRKLALVEQPPAAEPLSEIASRPFFRRLVNRRTLFWLALTVAVVIMLRIDEVRNRISPAIRRDREVASTPATHERLVHGPLPPSSIGAAPEPADRTPASSVRVGAPSVEKKAPSAPPSVAKEAELPSKPAAGELSLRNAVAETGSLDEFGPLAAEVGRRAGMALSMSAVKKQEGAGLLVVHCDISPDAAKSEAFDKLLDANGVVSYVERRQSDGANGADKKQIAAAGEMLIFAEATPAQLKAVLAGLEAQPEVFLAVSIKPAQDQTLRDTGGYDGQRRAASPRKSAAAGQERQEKEKAAAPAKGGRGRAEEEPANAGQSSPAPAEKSPAGQSRQTGPLTETQRQLQLQSKRRQVAQSPPRQRVLFVVRVIDRDRPSAAKEKK